MDNNPFRSSSNTPSSQFNAGNNNGYMSPGYGQPQQQQQPYGYSTPTGFSQQQAQPQQQGWQNNMTGPNTPYSPITSTATTTTTSSYQQPYNQQPYSQPYNQQQSFTTTPYQSQPQLQQQQQPYSPYNSNTNSSLMSSTTANSMSGGFGSTYQPYQATGMPTPDNYQQQSMYGNNMGMQQPQYNNSNFYIPPNFGQSTTTTTSNTYNNNGMYQPQQPKHAPVDASSLLKGTQVRRVECPVCQKMIEGDDMAVNHHVNEHYS